MVENWFKEMIFFHCGPWFPQELITASAICFEFWTYNHGQKSWDTFAFLGRFPIHTGPTPPLTPQTVLHACIQNFFRVSTLYSVGGGGGRTARKFWKVCTVLRGNREMTEKYEFCSTVPRSFVQDCRLVTMSRKSDHVTRYWPYHGVGTCAFSSPEPLGLICNWPRNDGLWGREWYVCFSASVVSFQNTFSRP